MKQDELVFPSLPFLCFFKLIKREIFCFLDVSDIRYVINYDYPNNMEDYIHRIGRTGRHNATGTSYTFLTDEDASKAGDLISVLREANQNVDPDLENLAMSAARPKKGYYYYYYCCVTVVEFLSLFKKD